METLFIGTNLMEFDCLASTNDFLLDLTREHQLPEGTVVITKNQQAGRGQQGNSWYTEANKNLTFSLLLYPKKLAIAKQFMISKLVSVAICEWLDSQGIKAQIKWPNDILVNEKKLAGILIENNLHTNGIRQSVVGIGLNVNQKTFPESLSFATSMTLLTNRNFDIKKALADLCGFIEKWYLRYSKDEILNNGYQQKLFALEQWRNYEDKQGVFLGKLIGTDTFGRIQIEDEMGGVRTYSFKEVVFRT